MKFKYKKYGKVTRPVIPVTLKTKQESITYEVLVDSGADFCLFDEEVADVLGIDVKKGRKEEVSGIGGKTSLFSFHDVTLSVGGWEYKINAGFMPSVSGRLGMPYGVVGQRGFFEHFVVKFDMQKSLVEVKRKET